MPRLTLQIYPGSKGSQHFPRLQRESGIAFDQMILWDDCTYGDNCRDVASACPGVVAVRTPRGLNEELFDKALQAFSEGKAGVVG